MSCFWCAVRVAGCGSVEGNVYTAVVTIAPVLLSTRVIGRSELLSFRSTRMPSFVSNAGSNLSVSSRRCGSNARSLR